MRRFAPLILLLCLPAHGTGIRTSLGDAIRATGDEIFQFAPPDGTGLPSVADLCDTYSGEMTGNYFCIRGDGTFLNGGQTMTAQGSPSITSRRLCPNGPNCTAASHVRFNGTSQYYSGANMASPTGNFSMCMTVMFDDVINRAFMGKGDPNTNLLSIRWETAANGSMTTQFYKTDASSGGVVSGILTNGVEYFVCTTYQFVTDGTSININYVNGVSDGTSNTMPGPIQAASTTKWLVGARFNTPGFFFPGHIRNAFMTEKVLSPSTIAAMGHTALADNPTGTHSESLGFTRNSSKFCTLVDHSAGSWIPIGRPCITGGGINFEGTASSTNQVIRSQAFDNAAWTKSSVTAPSADTDFAPDGTQSAEVLTNSGNGGFVESTSFVLSGTDFNGSVFVKTNSGTQSMSIAVRDTTAGADRCTATLTATTNWQRVYCFNNNGLNGNSHTLRIFPGGTGGTTGNSIVAWGGQFQGIYGGPSSYIATAGTSVTRAAEISLISLPFKPSGDISFSADLTSMVLAPHCPASVAISGDDRLIPLYTRSPGVSVWQFYGREDVTGYVFPASNFADTPADGSTTHVAFYYQNGSRSSLASVYRAGALLGTSAGGSRTKDIIDADRLTFNASFATTWGSVASNICVSHSVTGCQ